MQDPLAEPASSDLSEGSPQERLGGYMAESLADSADALRSHDVAELGQELSRFARRNPLVQTTA